MSNSIKKGEMSTTMIVVLILIFIVIAIATYSLAPIISSFKSIGN